ncbi:MAG: hypothetical protein HND48_05170 [Chloroflexi bacterium]|nr:hypothetical protein [Chloroflexota bacterium]
MQFEVATPAELPQWMRQSRRQIDWGFVLTGLIGLAMAWTIIVHPGIPVLSDLYTSAFMTSDLAAALREGQILPRWSPHANFWLWRAGSEPHPARGGVLGGGSRAVVHRGYVCGGEGRSLCILGRWRP